MIFPYYTIVCGLLFVHAKAVTMKGTHSLRSHEMPVVLQRPNIVILFADNMGYGDTSYNGHPTTQTPRLDEIASKGIRFTTWYSGSALCTPSRAAIFTGRYPSKIGMAGHNMFGSVLSTDSIGGLPKSVTTVGEALQALDYETHLIGKWHLGVGKNHTHMPHNHGFDTYYGVPYSSDEGMSAVGLTGSLAGSDPALPLMEYNKETETYDILEQPTNLNKMGERYLNQSKAIIDGAKKPYFLFVSFLHMHVPN